MNETQKELEQNLSIFACCPGIYLFMKTVRKRSLHIASVRNANSRSDHHNNQFDLGDFSVAGMYDAPSNKNDRTILCDCLIAIRSREPRIIRSWLAIGGRSSGQIDD